MSNLLMVHKTEENNLYIREFLLFMKSDKGCSDKTFRAYASDLDIFTRFFPGKDILKDLRETDIRNFKFSLVEKGLAPRTINRSLSVIRSFYDYYVNHDDWDIAKSPARNVQRMKVPRSVPITLNENEAETLLDGIVILGRFASRDYAIFSTFLFTGMRVAELINLEVGDVNFENETILIRKGKGGKDREVPMIPRLAEILKFYIETGISFVEVPDEKSRRGSLKIDLARCGRDYFVHEKEVKNLFLTMFGKAYSEKGVDYLFKNYINALGLAREGLTMNALRRSCLTFLYRQGVDLFVLKAISGHARIQTLEHYLNVDQAKVKLAANKHPLANRGMDHRIVKLIRNKK
ncbi:tyrosine-type recombinase/integrase [Brevibacillus brevis]|uniref:tyrosine-type recombinase/integrase n=1 Tax=Brevibacillus brevis TaxID=1393 RepID=UPI0037C58BA3